MPPTRKPATKRVNRVTKDVGIITIAAGKIPAEPANLCAHASGAWASYWGDVVSGAVREADTPLLLRWITNLDRYQRLIAQADAEPIVAGSTGQKRANPIYDLAFKLEASIKADEQQLGIGPLNRLKLGLAIGEATRSLADLDIEADGAEDDDPRLTLIADRVAP